MSEHHEVDRKRVENPRTGYMETRVALACGHVYTMGVNHDCDCPNCPAGMMSD